MDGQFHEKKWGCLFFMLKLLDEFIIPGGRLFLPNAGEGTILIIVFEN